jgi:glycosyltransferase involved in cell wall biosynthesis
VPIKCGALDNHPRPKPAEAVSERDKMRILFVALQFPVPANNGHKMRSWSLLRALAAEGHEVSLLSFRESEDAQPDDHVLNSVCREVTAVPFRMTNLSSGGEYLKRALAMFSPHPYASSRFFSAMMRERMDEILSQREFDLIIGDTVFSILNLPATDVPLALNAFDLEHLILERYLAHESNPLKLAYGWLESRKVRRWETQAFSQAAWVMSCSQHDRELVQCLHPGVATLVVPNIVDVDSYIPAGDVDQPVLIYQGGMDWYPNRDAVEYLAFEILPILRELVPHVRIVIAGRNPSTDFRRRFKDIAEMSFTGTVADMRLPIAKAAVCLVPLRIGSGTRMKILEAAAMGKPIVSTALGAEGLEFIDGSEILIADRPHAFAEAVAGLLSDPARRRSLGRAARRRVEQQYSMPVLRESLGELTTLVESEHGAEAVLAHPPR